MKILHVTKKYPSALGGDAVVVSNLEKQQKKAGHDVIILTSNCDEIKRSKQIYKFGIKDKPATLDTISPKRLFSLGMLYIKAYRVLKSERPDVIHTHSIDMAFFISFAARRYRIPIVHTFHCVTFNDSSQSILRRKSELFFLRRAKPRKVFIFDPTVIEDFKRAGFNNVSFVPNGINIKDWLTSVRKKTPGIFTFIAVGRLEREKGFEHLIDAAVMLRNARDDFRVLIVGDGSLHIKLQKQIRSLGAEKYVHLLGSRNQKQLKVLYANADAFVLPSLSEGMPIALLEAWATSLPTVVTKVKGIPFIAGEAAKQVEPGNAQQLKTVMAAFIKNSSLVKSLAERGHLLVEAKYQWKAVAKTIEEFYYDARKPHILHIADFVPPYLEGGGGGAISTTKNIEFLSKSSEYYILTRKHQEQPWLYASAKIYPVLPRIIITPRSVGQMLRYVMINSTTFAYNLQIRKYIKLLAPDMLYVTSNCLPLMRSAIKTGVPTFIDVRDDYFNDPIMSRRVPKEKNQFIYLYRHVVERDLVPTILKPFTAPIVAVFLIHAKLQRFLLRITISRNCNAYFIALSNYIKSTLIQFGIPGARIVTIYNSADINTQKNIYKPSKRNTDVIFAGIIEKTKGVWTILSAAEKLRKENIHFILVGSGPELANIKKYIHDNDLKKVKLVGKLPHNDVIKMYSKARIILGPSMWPEPFGRFIQESIATQTPLIASEVGGIPEGVRHRQTGLLVKPGDADGLAGSIKQLFNDKKLYRQIFDNLSTLKPTYSSEKLGAQRLHYMLEKIGKQT
jgi:glycosyltransferase involved in cell wall biosynthesis